MFIESAPGLSFARFHLRNARPKGPTEKNGFKVFQL